MINRLNVKILLFTSFIASIVLIITNTCDRSNKKHNQDNTKNSWEYSIRLGDSRSKVHELLGIPSRTTSEIEEYPTSGVSVWFDSENRIGKLNFAGPAIGIYGGTPKQLLSDNPILFGLTMRSNEATFRKVLGLPSLETQERSQAFREQRCIWKKEGYLINALFVLAERSDGDKLYQRGTLIWFEVSPTL